MAIYHFHVAAVSRAAGQSAVLSAAYITGTRRLDERTGRVGNYTRKAAEILATNTFGPIDWQAAERAEKRKDKLERHTITIELSSVQLAMFARISAIDGIADLVAALKDQARQYVVVAYRDILNYKEKAADHIWKGDFAG